MGYRGDDLDLRTPQAAAGDPSAFSQPAESIVARPRAPLAATRGAPIWVDDTVLECCNQAFDLAAAHRSAEVRLEHLIYTLTRIDKAAEALAIRGIRVTNLRREAATIVAGEIPASSGNGKVIPRRAEALEELLRVAAAHAYRRQAPVSVSDIVYALFESGEEVSSLLRPFPPTFRPAISHAATSLDAATIQRRMRNGSSQPPHGFATDLAGLSAAPAATQKARIDAIEQSIRTLTADLANERKILSGALQDLQRELMAQRDDTSRLGGLAHDKVQAVLGERLQSLEQAFLSGKLPASGDVGAMQDRLGLLERALQAEISVTRAAVEALVEKPSLDIAPLMQRFETMQETAAAERERANASQQSLTAGIEALALALDRQPAEISAVVVNPVTEHLNALSITRDAQHATTSDGLAEANRRLSALEETFRAHMARAETAEIRAAEERAALREQLGRHTGNITQEFDISREAFAKLTDNVSRDLSELHDGLSQVNAGQRTLASALDTESEDIASAFAALANRIEKLEMASVKPVEMLEGLSARVDKMHTITVEKNSRRNRFPSWLFSSYNWLAASWPSQTARASEELQNIKR